MQSGPPSRDHQEEAGEVPVDSLAKHAGGTIGAESRLAPGVAEVAECTESLTSSAERKECRPGCIYRVRPEPHDPDCPDLLRRWRKELYPSPRRSASGQLGGSGTQC